MERIKIKGEIWLRALELMENLTYNTGDFIKAFLSSSKSNYLALRNFLPKHYRTLAGAIRTSRQEKQRLYNLLQQLRHQKLITQQGDLWKITAQGQDIKEKLKARLATHLPLKKYKTEKSKGLIIVAFDVKEKERHRRDWLRSILANAGFQMLQKSLWVGKIKLPPEFITDLRASGLLSSVEIFAIGSQGTIKYII